MMIDIQCLVPPIIIFHNKWMDLHKQKRLHVVWTNIKIHKVIWWRSNHKSKRRKKNEIHAQPIKRDNARPLLSVSISIDELGRGMLLLCNHFVLRSKLNGTKSGYCIVTAKEKCLAPLLWYQTNFNFRSLFDISSSIAKLNRHTHTHTHTTCAHEKPWKQLNCSTCYDFYSFDFEETKSRSSVVTSGSDIVEFINFQPQKNL